MEWQTIDSAPKDGTSLLLVSAGYTPTVGKWLIPEITAEVWDLPDLDDYEGCWTAEALDEPDQAEDYLLGNTSYNPTHWMPIPKSPGVTP